MAIQTGDRIPEATLGMMSADGVGAITTSQLCDGKKVVLFAVPGAFTPTCSARHLPGFVDKADEIRAKGVDAVACMAVNDVFVMDAWGKSANVGDSVMMLADGNGDFTRALGLELDGRGFGMGERSQRFALVIDNGVVQQVHVESGGEFKVSSAEHILENL